MDTSLVNEAILLPASDCFCFVFVFCFWVSLTSDMYVNKDDVT